MKNRVIAFCIFSCIGITAEIFFTSIYSNVSALMNGETWSWQLKGHSYIWMFFIYGLASVFFPFAMNKMKRVPDIFRMMIFACGIYAVEFVSGFLLEKLTGSCPWEYKDGIHIMGYIRLDYLPAWMGFAYLLEQLVIFFQNLGLIPQSEL